MIANSFPGMVPPTHTISRAIVVVIAVAGCSSDASHAPKQETPAAPPPAALAPATTLPVSLAIGSIAAAPGGAAVALVLNTKTKEQLVAKLSGAQLSWIVPVGGNVTSFDLAVSDHHVFVRYQDPQRDDGEHVEAFELATGARKWSVEVRKIAAPFTPVPGRMLITSMAIAVRTGDHDGVFIDLVTGDLKKPLENVADWSRLVVEGTSLVDSHPRVRLNASEQARLMHALHVSNDEHLRSLSWMAVKQRGTYAGKQVFLVGPSPHILVVVTPRGKISAKIEFPGTAFEYDRSVDPKATVPELPRFAVVTYLVPLGGLQMGSAASVVDLEGGTATRILGPAEAAPIVIRNGDHWLVARGQQLVAIDGSTGATVRATMKYRRNNFFEGQVRDGTLWLSEGETRDRMIFERVDIATLAPQLGTDLVKPDS